MCLLVWWWISDSSSRVIGSIVFFLWHWLPFGSATTRCSFVSSLQEHNICSFSSSISSPSSKNMASLIKPPMTRWRKELKKFSLNLALKIDCKLFPRSSRSDKNHPTWVSEKNRLFGGSKMRMWQLCGSCHYCALSLSFWACYFTNPVYLGSFCLWCLWWAQCTVC